MIVYFADYTDKLEPVPVECEQSGYPNKDVDGRTMYENTHFLTQEEAWHCIFANLEADMCMSTRDVQYAEEALTGSKEDLVKCTIRWQTAKWKREAEANEATP